MTAAGLKRLILSVAIVALFVVIAGCAEAQSGAKGEREPEVQEQAVQPDDPNDDPNDGFVGAEGSDVLMMGRSVTEGLFQSWGWDWDGPVAHEGYTFSYHNLSGPPQIGEEAAARIGEVSDGTIVFFKLCFVDFWADNADDVEYLLSENLGYVDEVLDAVQGRDVVLILGNALPNVQGETTSALKDLHAAYNEGLEDRAAATSNVVVFDQYSLLTDSDGSLRRDFAVSSSDAHLNSDAYEEFDTELMALLDSLE